MAAIGRTAAEAQTIQTTLRRPPLVHLGSLVLVRHNLIALQQQFLHMQQFFLNHH